MLNYSGKLRGYLAENYIKNVAFAIEIGVSCQTVSYWLNRNIKPNFGHALAICNATKGHITMEEMGYET